MWQNFSKIFSFIYCYTKKKLENLKNLADNHLFKAWEFKEDLRKIYSDKENRVPFLSSKDVTSGKIDWLKIKYITSELFGGIEFYNKTIERDKAKKKLCKKHGINVLYYSNAHIDSPYPVFESFRLLLKAIKQNVHFEENAWLEAPELPFEFD